MTFVNDLFGADVKSNKIAFQPPGFSSGGLNFNYAPTGYESGATQPRIDAVTNLAGASGDLADTLGGLRATVTPGYNDLLKARLTEFNNNAASSMSNLRQNVSARRILGSSFGIDTLQRADTEAAQQRDAIVADNFQKSLQANTELATQEFNARRQQFQTGLDELNLEAGIAAQLTGKATDALSQIAQTQAKLDEDASKENAKNAMTTATGFGNLIGRVGGTFIPGFGSSNLFGSTK